MKLVIDEMNWTTITKSIGSVIIDEEIGKYKNFYIKIQPLSVVTSHYPSRIMIRTNLNPLLEDAFTQNSSFY